MRTAIYVFVFALGCSQSVVSSPDGGGDLSPASDLAQTAVVLPGTRLLEGGLGLAGVTRSGEAVVLDLTTRAISAVPLDGSGPRTIAPAAIQQTAGVDGDTVIVTSSGSIDVGPLALWTAATGLNRLAERSAYLWGVALSDDARWAVYLDGVSTDGKTADLIVSRIDGTQRKVLATSIAVEEDFDSGLGCSPAALWVGTHLAFATCPIDETMTEATIIDLAGDARMTLPSIGLGFGSDGEHVLVHVAGLELDAVSVQDGSTIVIDQNVVSAQLLPGGDVLYSTLDGGLRRRTPGKPVAPQILQQGGIDSILAVLSPDGDFVLTFGRFSQGVLVTSTRAMAPTVQTAANLGAPLGFTQDSTHFFFLEGFDRGAGVLQAISVSGGLPRTLSVEKTYWAQAGRGSTLWFNDHAELGGSSEIHVVDLADPRAGAKLFARPTDWQIFFLSPQKDRIVYTTLAEGSAGLYVAPVP